MRDLHTLLVLVPDEMGLLPAFGVPAIRRIALLARRVGVKPTYLVSRKDIVLSELSDLGWQPEILELEGPCDLRRVAQDLHLADEDRVLVLRANHIIDLCSLEKLIEAADGCGLYFMPANGNRGVDGAYVVHGAALTPVLEALWDPRASDGRVLAKAQKVPGLSGLPFSITEGKHACKVAEERLLGALAFQTEDDDGPLARHVDRRVSRWISKRAARLGVRPNFITLFGVAIGLSGAFFLSEPGYWSQLSGALAFLFCVIFDGVDGEVARLRLQETRFGHYLDVITDNVVHVAIFVGIAVGVYRVTGNLSYMLMLWILMGGFTLCAVSVYYCILRKGAEELKASPRLTRIMALLTNRDFAYVIVLFALVHRLNWFLTATAAGTYFFSAVLWVATLRDKKSQLVVIRH
jgi:phosphatidylglycerophosphate synthase